MTKSLVYVILFINSISYGQESSLMEEIRIDVDQEVLKEFTAIMVNSYKHYDRSKVYKYEFVVKEDETNDLLSSEDGFIDFRGYYTPTFVFTEQLNDLVKKGNIEFDESFVPFRSGAYFFFFYYEPYFSEIFYSRMELYNIRKENELFILSNIEEGKGGDVIFEVDWNNKVFSKIVVQDLDFLVKGKYSYWKGYLDKMSECNVTYIYGFEGGKFYEKSVYGYRRYDVTENFRYTNKFKIELQENFIGRGLKKKVY